MELMPYQVEGVEWLKTKHTAILGDDPGLGKTAQAIRACWAIGPWDIDSVLIVCPASLRLNWMLEWHKWSLGPGMPEPTIVSYNEATTNKAIYKKKWTVLIYDEAHYLKSKGNRPKKKKGVKVKYKNPHRAVRLLGTTTVREEEVTRRGGISADYRWFLTGSPITTGPADFYNLLHFCAPTVFFSRSAYEMEFCDGKYGDFGWEAKGATNIGRLKKRILDAGILLRRLKKNVLSQLPPKMRQVVEVPRASIDKDGKQALKGEEAALRELLGTGFEGELQTATDEELYEAVMNKRYQKFEAIDKVKIEQGASNAHEFRLLLAPAKVAAFLAYAKDEIKPRAGEKVIVWAYYHETIAALKAGLDDLKIKSVVFDGTTSDKNRHAAVQSFQNDPETQVFVGSSAAYEGLTLTASNRSIVVEGSFIPGKNTQLEDRIHRIGQEKPVLIQYLAVEGSYDLRILRVVVERMSVIKKLLG